ncbi:hypothetical protein NX059_007904 [Plenodomus lindquistii]|nr:hypothetical protein NX059_007904 [Plenodomus lindquistii]
MSNLSSTLGSSRGSPQRPQTPDQRSALARTGSTVVPKSEYLRNALEARRAQNTPTPSLEIRPPPPPIPQTTTTQTPDSSPDAFAEFALTEEQTAPESPIRRRRPSEAGPPRSRTNRELTIEIEKLKDSLMTSNMRVELLKKSNSELQHNMTKAKERIEKLEPLEEDNYELQLENGHLKTKLEHVEEEIERLADANDAIRKINGELTKSNEQLSALSKQNADLWQSQESALDEAVMYIIKLEEDKTILSTELESLKDRVSALESASPASTLVDGASRYPSRVFSVDESRPSTSHFDSDYYSQPDSPRVKPDTASTISFTPSERSRKFLDLTEDRRKSARDLAKRMSAASLTALTIRSPSPAPAVPQIPVAFREKPQPVSRPTVDVPSVGNPTVPGRYREGRHAVPQDLVDEALRSPTLPEAKPQRSAIPHADGLRGLYRPDRPTRSKTSHDSPSRSGKPISPTKVGSAANRQSSVAETSPRVPSRASSKHANTNSSGEQLPRHVHHHVQSINDMRGSSDNAGVEKQHVPPPRAPTAPPPSNPTMSTMDLTSEYDPLEDRDRWWRGVEQITSSPITSQPRTPLDIPAHAHDSSPMITTATAHRRRHRKAPSLGVVNERQTRTTPSTPKDERDFLFNPRENVETFMRKAKNKITSSSQRQA